MKLDRRNLKLDDVAARAGVSASTVSRYINKPSVVAEETAQRIQSAIDAIGYVPADRSAPADDGRAKTQEDFVRRSRELIGAMEKQLIAGRW